MLLETSAADCSASAGLLQHTHSSAIGQLKLRARRKKKRLTERERYILFKIKLASEGWPYDWIDVLVTPDRLSMAHPLDCCSWQKLISCLTDSLAEAKVVVYSSWLVCLSVLLAKTRIKPICRPIICLKVYVWSYKKAQKSAKPSTLEPRLCILLEHYWQWSVCVYSKRWLFLGKSTHSSLLTLLEHLTSGKCVPTANKCLTCNASKTIHRLPYWTMQIIAFSIFSSFNVRLGVCHQPS